MPNVIRDAVSVALEWGIPAALTGIGAWFAVRRREIRDRWRKRKQRKGAQDAMLDSWPSALAFIADAKTREDSSVARESRVTAEFAAIREHLVRQDGTLEAIAAQLWGAMKLDPQARFQCDHTGRNLQVNAAYAAMMRVGEFDLTGFGWKNRLAESTRDEYERAAAQAFSDHRKFERSTVFCRGDSTCFRGLVRIEPYPEDPADLKGGNARWFGTVTYIEEVE